MSNSMVDRVARAIYKESRGVNPPDRAPQDDFVSNEIAAWKSWLALARIAIAAMPEQHNPELEITREMTEEGVLAYSLWYARAGRDDCSLGTMVREIWAAMEHARAVEPE